MKSFSPALAAHLAAGRRRFAPAGGSCAATASVLGFTDHDRTIAFDGVEHEPASGLDASDAVAHAGLQVGGLEVTGAFASERITESGSRGRALRQCARRGVAGELGGAGRAASDARRLDRRGEARRAVRSRRRSAASRMRSTRSAGGFFARPATPISATRAAGSISTSAEWTASATVVGDGRLCAARRALVPGDAAERASSTRASLTFTSGANAGRRERGAAACARRRTATISSCGRRWPRRSRRATRSRSRPAATSALRPAATASTTP